MICDGVGAEGRLVQPGGDRDADRLAVHHLLGQGDRGVGQRPAVRDDDEPDASPPSPALPANADGGRRDQQGRRRRAGVLVPDAALARGSWPGPCAPASASSRRGPPRRRRAARQRRPRVRAVRERGVQRVAPPGPARRTSSCRRPRPCRARRRRRARPAAPPRSPRRRRRRRRRARRAIRRKNVPKSGPLAPPTVLTSVMPDLLEQRAGVGGLAPRRARPRRPSCRGPCWPVVGVADRRVELGQGSVFSATTRANSRTQPVEDRHGRRCRPCQIPIAAPAC